MDDEDVIFRGSPLYDHLKAVGIEDFEIAEKFPKHTPKPCIKDSQKRCLTTWIKKLNLSFLKFILLKDFNAKYEEFGGKLNGIIIESPLLTTTDRLILQDFSFLHSTQKHTFFQNWHRYACVVFLLFGYCVSKFGSEATAASKTVEVTLLAILTVVTAAFAVQIISFVLCWRVTSNVMQLLSETIQVFAHVKSLIRKGIRNVQEAELIARGFTLASISNPISRLENSSLPFKAIGKQFPEYRRFLWSAIMSSFLRYRSATLNLLNSCLIASEVDVPSFYISCVSLKDLGPLFDEETNSDQLVEITNDFSVSSLKLAFQIMELQQSELLRRTGLCFIPMPGAGYSLSAIKIMKSHFEELLASSRTLATKLNIFHLFHKRIHLDDAPVVASKHIIQTDLHKFQMAMHSLSLHLQAVILRTQKLEEEEDEEIDCGKFDDLLIGVRAELDASHVCLEEAALHLLSMKGEKPQINKIPLPPMAAPKVEDGAAASPIPLFEMEDLVVPDQVFEGTTSGLNDPDAALNDYHDDFWLEDRVRKKAAKEASVHLFKELKSVLVVKAEEHRNRGLMGDTKSPDTSPAGSLDRNIVRSEQNSLEETPTTEIPSENDNIEKQSFQMNAKAACGDEIEKESSESRKDAANIFSLASFVAAQAAQRSKILGFKVDTIGDESFGDSSDSGDS